MRIGWPNSPSAVSDQPEAVIGSIEFFAAERPLKIKESVVIPALKLAFYNLHH